MKGSTMSRKKTAGKAGLMARLDKGPVICAEGYLFELERRGYLQAGAYVPEVVLEHPELVEQLHREFVHAGSDIVEAFTYYAHRQKLRVIGREKDLKPMNLNALAIARKVARDTDTLLAGNICNTTIYDPKDPATIKTVRAMFEEQVGWAVDAGVDFIIGETFGYTQEALLALDVIKQAGQVAVITLAAHKGRTREGWSWANAARRLEQAGADVVGLNCTRGPASMLPLLAEMRKAVKCHLAALPVPYRTTRARPSFQSLTDHGCSCLPGGHAFPIALDPFTCNRFEIAEFGAAAHGMGIHYLGVCCGAGPHHVRALAEAVGKRPPAMRYTADMSKHYLFGRATLGKTSRQKAEDRRFAKAIVQA
jgi:betaine-homocysteine S-methyltransferase